jgi:hypothetical protein
VTTIYRVSSSEKIHPSDPLHVGKFYPHTVRHHVQKMQDRQDLILYLASIHAASVKIKKPRGFSQIPMRLMTLREWVYDYKVVFDHFFEIVSHGYNLGEKNEISFVIPKKLSIQVVGPKRKLLYQPPLRPTEGAVSKVFVQQQNRAAIMDKLAVSGRLDLYAPVDWLLSLPSNEVNFYFSPSGRLKLRDTSTWPVAAMETWPSWLREDLFGGGIDIDSAYTQFLIEHLKHTFAGREKMLTLLYPDLVRSLEDKKAWRREICVDVLGLPFTDDNISIVKKICMSLANGSRISPAILAGNSAYSITRDIILQKTEDLTQTNLIRIGARLSQISKQYSAARKLVCTTEIGLNPTRQNQKRVFTTYFEWERAARYEIWNAVDCHGIMVHDGIDGIPDKYLQDIPGLIANLNIRLTSS